MKQSIHTERTQISLSPELKALIESRGHLQSESLSEYLRKAAVIRMAIEDTEKTELRRIAQAVVGSIPHEKSGWANIKNIGEWQRKERQSEDRHRS